MEEILASIRKIISEDDDTRASEPAANELRPEEIPMGEETREDEGLSLDALAGETRQDDDMFEEFDLSDLEDSDPGHPETAGAGIVEETVDDFDAAAGDLDDDLDGFGDEPVDLIEDDLEDFSLADDGPVEEDFAAFEPDPVAEAEPIAAPEPEPLASPHKAPAEQTMQALTEEATETAAAGALAKLVAKMDMGSENTLEGMVKELVKPMIKEWLDANLPDIVEDKVELEVQRISRLAR
ncbi:MAG: DUF2497 domain-containing protein [Pseudomonadota bacterium]